MFGQGISKEGDILDLAVDCNVINKSGSWYAYNGEKIGQGRENAKQYLKEHPEIRDDVEKQVRIHYELIESDDKDNTAEKKPEEKAAKPSKETAKPEDDKNTKEE